MHTDMAAKQATDDFQGRVTRWLSIGIREGYGFKQKVIVHKFAKNASNQ